MTPDAAVLAMRTMAPVPSGEMPALALRLYDGRHRDPPVRNYQVAAVDGRLDVRTGVVPAPAATVTADSTVWSNVLFDHRPLPGAERDGTVSVTGERSAAVRLVRLYAPG
jgi:hypothetical protein